MRKSTAFTRALLVAVLGTALLGTGARAQVPSASPPYNTDIGAVITNAGRGPGTTTSIQLGNLDKNGAICTLVTTAQSGSPTVTFSIQNYDSASQSYYSVVTSTSQQASTLPSTPISVMVSGQGIQTSSLPATISAGQGVPLTRYWRVSETVVGVGDTLTGTIGCNQVK